jgi:hypothetical protein
MSMAPIERGIDDGDGDEEDDDDDNDDDDEANDEWDRELNGHDGASLTYYYMYSTYLPS